MHVLLNLNASAEGQYDAGLSNIECVQESTTRQHSREPHISKNRLLGADVLSPKNNSVQPRARRVFKIWEMFVKIVSKINSFPLCNRCTEENNCTWRIICKCGNCNANQKLKTLTTEWVLNPEELQILIYYYYYCDCIISRICPVI